MKSKFKLECNVEIKNEDNVIVATVGFRTAANQIIILTTIDDSTASGEMVIKELIAMKHKKR